MAAIRPGIVAVTSDTWHALRIISVALLDAALYSSNRCAGIGRFDQPIKSVELPLAKPRQPDCTCGRYRRVPHFGVRIILGPIGRSAVHKIVRQQWRQEP